MTLSPQSAVDASTGAATGAAGQAQTTTDNSQLSAGSVGGGSGALTVTNQHSSSIDDASAANASTGLSVALAPTQTTGATAPQGVTTANSGASSATGIAVQNTVNTSSELAVQVNGGSTAPVNVTSNSAVTVQNRGAADASTGAAWAVASGATGSPTGVSAPVVGAATSSTSSAASATGLQANTALSNQTNTMITSAGGRTNTAPINVTPDQSVVAENWGVGVAKSAPTCAGAGCTAPVGTIGSLVATGAVGATQSASGASTAEGLTAQNQVSTNAQVAVTVKGHNYAPINVIVDSLTHLFNLGLAQSGSGSSVAMGANIAGSSVGPSTTVSGAAQALGANVQNQVDLSSGATVRVNGDNYSPIDIVLRLAANLVNWGMGVATSGDSQSQGAPAGGGSSTTGPATAQGLAVVNVVRMWADANVDVEGDNYAPITIQIDFQTNIDNRGLAIAHSGNTAAGNAQGGGRPSTAGAGAASGSAVSTGNADGSSSATGGRAVAISNSVNAQVDSAQMAAATGGKSINESVANIINQLPRGTWNPLLDQNLGTTGVPTPQAGLNSASGDSTARGLHSDMIQSNTQLVACADPSVACTAQNSATLNSRASDMPSNPASPVSNSGGTNATSGDALANATPTPTPQPATQRSSNHPSSNGRHASVPSQQVQETVTSNTAATGHVVVFDLWSNWPGRRLPPMPDPNASGPAHSSVSVSLDQFPGEDELPLPDLSGGAPAPLRTSTAARLPRGAASSDSLLEPEDDEVPLLGVYDFDPWSEWPQVDDIPMPLQMMPAQVETAGQQVAASNDAEAAIGAPPDDGVLPMDFGPAAIITAVLGLLGGTWRSRRALRLWIASVRRMNLRLPAAARALALVRLGLGLLRLW